MKMFIRRKVQSQLIPSCRCESDDRLPPEVLIDELTITDSGAGGVPSI